ncbi:ciliary neurotrophic factor receptor subunit alpha-like [Crotalus adamanteus]|uniref:Ciliary neurotrophic factor receptor subunit alpha-like n=1 Tax=Crotalus adamanteus TaxID=8729 RepID=A0AAW1C317_CROAD
MASPVPAACCVMFTAMVVVYAQKHSQQESHVHYAQLGTDVTIPCSSVDQGTPVTWTANSTDLDASHLNGSHLVLRNVDLSHNGQYSCYEGSSWHLKDRVNLKVGTLGSLDGALLMNCRDDVVDLEKARCHTLPGSVFSESRLVGVKVVHCDVLESRWKPASVPGLGRLAEGHPQQPGRAKGSRLAPFPVTSLQPANLSLKSWQSRRKTWAA